MVVVEAVVLHDYKANQDDELTLKKGDIITDILLKQAGWSEGYLARLGKRGMFPHNFVSILDQEDNKTTDSLQKNKEKEGGGKVKRRCKVLFDYKPGNSDELELRVGDIIDVLDEIEDGWWQGQLHNTTGVFPSNFVIEMKESAKNPLSETVQKKPKSEEEGKKEGVGELTDGQELKSELNITQSVSPSSTKSDNKREGMNDISNQPTSESLPALPPKPTKEQCQVIFAYTAKNEDELTLQVGETITILSKNSADDGWWKGELNGKIGVFPDNFVRLINFNNDLVSTTTKSQPGVKLKETNLMVTKSSSSASIHKTSVGTYGSNSATRKLSDSGRHEKASPPSIGKKPVLPPPPFKKPTLSPTSSESKFTSKSEESKHEGDSAMRKVHETAKQITDSKIISTTSPTSVMRTVSSSSLSMNKQNTSAMESSKWNSVESDTADGLSWSKQSSYSLTSTTGVGWTSSSNSSQVVIRGSNVTTTSCSGSSIGSSATVDKETWKTTGTTSPPQTDLDLDSVGRTALLKHLTASRAKVPKRRLPSALFTREESRDSNDEESMVNGVGEAPVVAISGQDRGMSAKFTPNWVEELKQNQAAKKSAAAAAAQGGGKTRVMIGGGEGSVDSGVSSGNSGANVTMRQTPSTTQRPLSLHTHLSSTGINPTSSASLHDTIPVPRSVWNDFREKLESLENKQESLREELRKAVKEIHETLHGQALKQQKLLQDVERLTNLVTQV